MPLIPPLITPNINPLSNRKPDDPVKRAAAQYGVPDYILRGVWGMETDFGTNVKTSSAGAVGDFQFLPSTAAGYNYPLTNTPNDVQFQAQANGAAKYLSDLYKQYGSWDAALRHYSGGGYGLDEVTNKSRSSDAPSGSSPSVADQAAQATSDALSIPAKFYALITDAGTWIRIGEAVAGLALIYVGLRTLTGGM